MSSVAVTFIASLHEASRSSGREFVAVRTKLLALEGET
jgi:hypothetical protein